MTKQTKIVGEICLYGSSYAAGWLARTADNKMLGDGEPRQGRSLNDATWLAAEAIKEAGTTTGLVRIFEPNGLKMATMDLARFCYYGDLKWEPAIVYTISVEEILKHAEEPR